MNFSFSPEVREALDTGRPIVALESTLIAHGFDYPENLEVGERVESVVREAGAVPATIALIDGTVKIGLTSDEMRIVATKPEIPKLSLRDLGVAAGLRCCGATTVASTAFLAAKAGIRVFSTGGLGGVHRGARDTWDISADLMTLAGTPVIVICSGVKSLLDIPATLEVLETFNVPVIGYQTNRFPGFYVRDSGFPVPWKADSPSQISDVFRAQLGCGLFTALVVANPVPAEYAVDPDTHDSWISQALNDLDREGIRGKGVTPFMLRDIKRLSGSRSVAANMALIMNNAALAAAIAIDLAEN